MPVVAGRLVEMPLKVSYSMIVSHNITLTDPWKIQPGMKPLLCHCWSKSNKPFNNFSHIYNFEPRDKLTLMKMYSSFNLEGNVSGMYSKSPRDVSQ